VTSVRGWLILAILPSCASEPSADDRTAGQIVATRFDPSVDFGSFSTFAIDPVVSTTSDASSGGVAGAVGNAVIINQIVANMLARGYRQTEVSSGPDMGINATVFTRVKSATSVTTGYWWGLPGYGATPAYWGYPAGTYYAPWNYESLAFKSTTLIIQIVDLHDVMPVSVSPLGTPEGVVGRTRAIDAGAFSDAGTAVALDVAWTAVLHGYVVEGGTLVPEVPGAIDQAFAQSPYLQKR
jgi:hypothetical protein